MRPRRNRHHFHTFALDDREEEVLKKAKKITGENLTNTLMSALNTYVKENSFRLKEKENKSTSIFDLIEEIYKITRGS